MRVGFSGRPSSLSGMPGSSPRERIAGYASACFQLGLGCLELPGFVLFGKGGWRNHYLSACTESTFAQSVASSASSTGSVDVLVRIRPSDCFAVYAQSAQVRRPAEADYARHLVRMIGARLATVLMKSERSLVDPDFAGPTSQGAARIGLVLNWSDQDAILAAARAVRRSAHIVMLPLLNLGSDGPRRMERNVERALSVCRSENRGKDSYLFVSLPRSGCPTSCATPADIKAILAAVGRFEEETACEIGVIFSGCGSEACAHRAAGIARELKRPAVNGRTGPPGAEVGSTVMIRDVELGLDMQYAIVPPEHASVMAGRLSSESPVAKAIMGRPPGARVEVAAPDGRVIYELLEVRN